MTKGCAEDRRGCCLWCKDGEHWRQVVGAEEKRVGSAWYGGQYFLVGGREVAKWRCEGEDVRPLESGKTRCSGAGSPEGHGLGPYHKLYKATTLDASGLGRCARASNRSVPDFQCAAERGS